MSETGLGVDGSFEADIPIDVARSAHSGTSFVPDDRARQERSSYSASLQRDYAHLHAQAIEGGTLDVLPAEFERYRDGLRRRTIDYLNSRSRCLSPMITGRSKFPVDRNNRRNVAADNKLNALVEYRKVALRAILRKLRPDLAPVRSGDSDAVERLEEQLQQLVETQERMKTANAAIRRYRKSGADAQIAALTELGFSRAVAAQLLIPDSCGRIGFADFELQNNNASIRRVRRRIAEISHNQSRPVTAIDGAHARLEDDPPANRVRLFFPSKPNEALRTRLKKNGFRWAPGIGVWQAYRNPESLRTAREIAEIR